MLKVILYSHFSPSSTAELPGPPTNLAVSNIGPRSVTLQFKPGYDGKTSISRWQVEAQVRPFMFCSLFLYLSWLSRCFFFFFFVTTPANSFSCVSHYPSTPLRVFQIGIIGENEEWLLVHQLSNEPDARSLEVQDLNPYTFYRWAPHPHNTHSNRGRHSRTSFSVL